MDGYLIEQIIEITEDKESVPFWTKAIKELGDGIVSEELGELKYQMQTQEVRNPAKYLTALLKTQMERQKTKPETQKQEQKPLKKHFEENQMALFKNLTPQKPTGESEQKKMEIPYGKENIPWATFISSNFFTLSTNKEKSDVVMARFRTMDGQSTAVPLTRGRLKPGSKAWGIPTAEHGRILAAISNMWAQQGCRYRKYEIGMVTCFCHVSIRELAQAIGRESFGGRDLIHLVNKVYDLKVMPYYLDLTNLGIPGMTGYGFSLLSRVDLIDGKRNGQEETLLYVEFSTPLSVQLLNRHAVIKPKEITQIHSELGFLLRLYVEPILLSINGAEFSKSLKDLVKELTLPTAAWHGHKGKRRQTFEKALKTMIRQKAMDGRMIVWGIQKGLFDWMLTARLVFVTGKEN